MSDEQPWSDETRPVNPPGPPLAVSQGSGYGAPAAPKTGWALEVSEGQPWAFLSYLSMFIGFPLFIIPFFEKNNRFAVFHAKQAAVIYIEGIILGLAIALVSFVTCGLGVFLVPLAFLAYIPTIHGLILTANGRTDTPMLTFGLGERLFAAVDVQPKPEYGERGAAASAPEGQAG